VEMTGSGERCTLCISRDRSAVPTGR
jgi:hypothetical protein